MSSNTSATQSQHIYSNQYYDNQRIINGGFEIVNILPTDSTSFDVTYSNRNNDGILVYYDSTVVDNKNGYYVYTNDHWRQLLYGGLTVSSNGILLEINGNVSTANIINSDINVNAKKATINISDTSFNTTLDISTRGVITHTLNTLNATIMLTGTYLKVNDYTFTFPITKYSITDNLQTLVKTVHIECPSFGTTFSLGNTDYKKFVSIDNMTVSIPTTSLNGGILDINGATTSIVNNIILNNTNNGSTSYTPTNGKVDLSSLNSDIYVVLKNGKIPTDYIPGSVNEYQTVEKFMIFTSTFNDPSASDLINTYKLTEQDSSIYVFNTLSKLYHYTNDGVTQSVVEVNKSDILLDGGIYCNFGYNTTINSVLLTYDSTSGNFNATPSLCSLDRVYVDIDRNKVYRWVWTDTTEPHSVGRMVEVLSSLVIGEGYNQAASGLVVKNIIDGKQYINTTINTPTVEWTNPSSLNTTTYSNNTLFNTSLKDIAWLYDTLYKGTSFDLTPDTISTDDNINIIPQSSNVQALLNLFSGCINTLQQKLTDTINNNVNEYVITKASNTVFTVPLTEHKCGKFPIVQVEVNNRVVIVDIENVDGNLTITSNVEIAPTIKIIGKKSL